jgi:hypothetical protein
MEPLTLAGIIVIYQTEKSVSISLSRRPPATNDGHALVVSLLSA